MGVEVKVGSSNSDALNQARLRETIARQQKSWWLPVLLGALAAVPELSGPSKFWVLVLAACLPIIAVTGTLVYRRKRESLKALFFMIDGLVFSVFPLLMLMIWNIFRRLNTYWLFSDYYYLYITIMIFALGYGIYYGIRRWPPRIEELGKVMQSLSIDTGSVYRYLFASHGAATWASGRVKVFIGIASISSIVVSGIGGQGYLFAAASFWAVIFLPPIMGSALVRRWYLRKLLGSNDISIMFTEHVGKSQGVMR